MTKYPKITKGPWKAIYVCTKCREPMKYTTMMNSGGVCPGCGNTAQGTVVDCETIAARLIYRRGAWWKLPRCTGNEILAATSAVTGDYRVQSPEELL